MARGPQHALHKLRELAYNRSWCSDHRRWIVVPASAADEVHPTIGDHKSWWGVTSGSWRDDSAIGTGAAITSARTT